MSLRDRFLSYRPPHEDVATALGLVRVRAPSVARTQLFIKKLGSGEGDRNRQLDMTPAVLTALSCHDPETDQPLFGPEDVTRLDELPPTVLMPIIDAVSRLADQATLDPTMTATPT